MMPRAVRNQFAVEIYLPTGTRVERSSQIADSLEAILSKDDRVVSIANFHGCASPRFQTTYAPQVGGPNYAQFIVNTKDDKATQQLLNEYTPRYEAYFPDAIIKFKQLSYSNADNPVEVRISGENLARLQAVSDTVMSIMRADENLKIVRSSLDMPSMATLVKPDPVQMSRLGTTTGNVELDLAMRYGDGIPVGTLWEGDYAKKVVLKSNHADLSNVSELENGMLPTLGIANVTLNQFADVVPSPGYGQISHLNGVKTIYVSASVPFDKYAMTVTDNLKKKIDALDLPEGVEITWGGEAENTGTVLPQIMTALLLSIFIIFFILLFHYKKIGVTLLLLFSIIFCLPGAGIGLWIENIAFSVTCTLGIISLMGILVRNVIIMIDYAEELQVTDGLSVKDAIFESARRRMRPIFLTSAAASMGVIPMVLAKSPLWMPMGSVIFWGTIITMFFILTIIPVLYWKTQKPAKNETV